MMIKLKRKAQWGGKSRKANSVHEVDALVADKLFARDLAVPHQEPDVSAHVKGLEEASEDGPTASN
jgi:hypothetical protein